jgi:hypothetical protein
VLLPLLVGALVVALPVPAGLTTEADEPIPDGTLLVLINAEPDPVSCCFPTVHPSLRWEVLVGTAEGAAPMKSLVLDPTASACSQAARSRFSTPASRRSTARTPKSLPSG